MPFWVVRRILVLSCWTPCAGPGERERRLSAFSGLLLLWALRPPKAAHTLPGWMWGERAEREPGAVRAEPGQGHAAVGTWCGRKKAGVQGCRGEGPKGRGRLCRLSHEQLSPATCALLGGDDGLPATVSSLSSSLSCLCPKAHVPPLPLPGPHWLPLHSGFSLCPLPIAALTACFTMVCLRGCLSDGPVCLGAGRGPFSHGAVA